MLTGYQLKIADFSNISNDNAEILVLTLLLKKTMSPMMINTRRIRILSITVSKTICQT